MGFIPTQKPGSFQEAGGKAKHSPASHVTTPYYHLYTSSAYDAAADINSSESANEVLERKAKEHKVTFLLG